MINYRIGEHYYTASKFKNGFDTIDFSSFLNRDEVNIIERLGLYKSAEGLNYSPSEDEINEKFPINLAFYRIPSLPNRFVYLHSNYTGKANHTPDRNGNYFSHSLILKDLEPLCPAVFIFNNFSFENKLTIEQDISYQPHLDENEITIDNDDLRVYRQYFIRFIEKIEKDSTINLFAKLIDLITEGKLINRANRISICGENLKVKEIILAINFFLPQIIANKISFATYVNDPLGTPFQLTGIIPECRISSLDPRYYTLIDATTDFEYVPKHEYTKFLIDIINEKSEKSYNKWNMFNRQLVDEFGIIEASVKLNIPILFSNFINDPLNKEIVDFKLLISSNLPLEKEFELKRVTAEKNPQMYLEFVVEEFKIRTTNIYQFNEIKDVFKKIYSEHFEKNNLFRQSYLPFITDSFREISKNNLNMASLYVLIVANCSDIIPENWLGKTLEQADDYFANETISIETKLEPIRILNEKYKLQKYNEIIPNIMKTKLYDDIRQAAEKDDFVRSIKKHQEKIYIASDKEKMELLLIGFNHDANFYKGNFKNFDYHIKVINLFLKEKQPEFWSRFFDDNQNFNKERNPQKHSLDYLKKKFVSMIFLNQNENHDLFSKLKLDDSYTFRWIEEDIREHTSREAILETFAEAFKDNSSIRNNSFWNLFKKNNG